jgi:hypothetical protein
MNSAVTQNFSVFKVVIFHGILAIVVPEDGSDGAGVSCADLQDWHDPHTHVHPVWPQCYSENSIGCWGQCEL